MVLLYGGKSQWEKIAQMHVGGRVFAPTFRKGIASPKIPSKIDKVEGTLDA